LHLKSCLDSPIIHVSYLWNTNASCIHAAINFFTSCAGNFLLLGHIKPLLTWLWCRYAPCHPDQAFVQALSQSHDPLFINLDFFFFSVIRKAAIRNYLDLPPLESQQPTPPEMQSFNLFSGPKSVSGADAHKEGMRTI
jgi:hypothetical protein